MDATNKRLSTKLMDFSEQTKSDKATLSDLIRLFGVESHALVILFLAIPFLLPIPLPGLSLIFGGMIALSGFAFILNKPIWLPKKIAGYHLSPELMGKIFVAAAKFLKKIEHLIKPRYQFLFKSRTLTTIIGLLIISSGLILALPLPPGTNFPPATVILVLSLGVLEKDGALVVLGFCLFAIKIILAKNLIGYLGQYLPKLVARHEMVTDFFHLCT